MSERVNFGGGEFSRTRHEDGFCTADGWLPAAQLIGETVNLGGKDGQVYEAVTVTAVTRQGELSIEGGRIGWPLQPEREPVAVKPGERVPVTEVARGFIHARERTS